MNPKSKRRRPPEIHSTDLKCSMESIRIPRGRDGATMLAVFDLTGGLYVVRLTYPRLGKDYTGELDDDEIVAFVNEHTPDNVALSVDMIRWDAAETTDDEYPGRIMIDLAMCLYATPTDPPAPKGGLVVRGPPMGDG